MKFVVSSLYSPSVVSNSVMSRLELYKCNDTKLGIDESMSDSNWDIWLNYVTKKLITEGQIGNKFVWYVGEESYEKSLAERSKYMWKINDIVYIERDKNPISASMIRENPIKYWNKIAWPFRQFFSTNILITGTASEGKSTLTRDIATYFGLPYSEEYGRTYMEYYAKSDTDLTVTDFQEFLIEQRRDTQKKIASPGNCGIVISDTDNLVTLMYAKAYVEDNNIDLTEDDYKTLEQLAWNIKRGYLWCFDKEPVLGKYGDWESNGGNCISIGDFAILPDITFENSPQKAILEFVN